MLTRAQRNAKRATASQYLFVGHCPGQDALGMLVLGDGTVIKGEVVRADSYRQRNTACLRHHWSRRAYGGDHARRSLLQGYPRGEGLVRDARRQGTSRLDLGSPNLRRV